MKQKCHLEGSACGGATFYTDGALRVLALDDLSCKRCLASLARRDRAFQRKARRRLGLAFGSNCFASVRSPTVAAGLAYRFSVDAAREEGPAL